MLLKDILTVLDSIAPFETAEEWDNVGLMVGDSGSEVHSILVALDPSIEVIKAAKGSDIDLILTHHPLMLHPIRYLDIREGISKKIALLIESRINLVSMHTNLDNAPGGVADELASSLGLKDVRPFGALRIGTIGTHKPLDGWLKSLPIRNAHFIDAGRDVCMVGACPGSGMEYWYQAWQMGCDTFVTGDVRYHAAYDALDAGLNVVDLGHFSTEEIIIRPLAEKLKQRLKGLNVRAHTTRDIFSYYHQ
jgi:dinuclear metal center YbgI/SA1388 family protein